MQEHDSEYREPLDHIYAVAAKFIHLVFTFTLVHRSRLNVVSNPVAA